MGYNEPNAPRIGNLAAGSVQLFADQSSGAGVGPGVEPPGMLPPRRKTSLRNDGDAIGIAVRSFASNSPMLQLPVLWRDCGQPGGKPAWTFTIRSYRILQLFSFSSSDGNPLFKLL
jgi:hypothetical protein